MQDPSSTIRQRTYRKLAEPLRDPQCPIELLALLAFAAKEPEREHREQIRRLMLQIIDTRREHIKLQLSYKTAPTSNGHPPTNGFDEDERSNIDYTLYPEYSLTYFLYFLSKSPAFILHDDVEMLHTMTDYILFLIDALLLRCDTTVGLFYKGLLRSIKSSEDATLAVEKEERKDANKKLHVLVDLAYVILSQRASSLMMCRASSNVPLSELYFKKTRYNHLSSLPKDFQIKLKPISTTTVSESAPAKRPVISQQSDANESSVSTTSRAKRKSEVENENEQSKEQNSPKKRQKTSTTSKSRKRKISPAMTENNERTTSKKQSALWRFTRIFAVFVSASPATNGNKSRKTATGTSSRSRVNFVYEKPQLRSASVSSASPTPSPPTRKTRGKVPSRLAAKN